MPEQEEGLERGSEWISPGEQKNILMFSGGRDSTLAAVRLAQQQVPLELVTITSNHLVGVNRVRQRLRGLKHLLPGSTQWILIKQPEELKTDTTFYAQTCLPCHHAYVVAGCGIAAKAKAKTLAFGYASYQNGWPEQSPLAVTTLNRVLARHSIELVLPVYDIMSKEDVILELKANQLSDESLEQKCLRQVNNIVLDPARLEQQIGLWEKAIDESVNVIDQISIEVVEVARLDALA